MTLSTHMQPTDPLAAAINQAIQDETSRIIAEEAKAAGVRVEQRVRESAAGIVARLARHIDVVAAADRLVITVRFPEPGK